ncbi:MULTISPECIES: hypothetical protein [unclassified Streptomyces]|uniref:hypothetical protein n=1 Tax=unclassified Streptomyces TaxID=2593676 RepID=UPI0038152992
MSTSDQEQTVDAATGAPGAAKVTVPEQPPARRPSTPENAEARDGAQGSESPRSEAPAVAQQADGSDELNDSKDSKDSKGLTAAAKEPAGSVGDVMDPEAPEDSDDSTDEPVRQGMAPRQARRLRMVAAGVLMAAMAVVLVVRLATRSSVLVVGVYGLALILCGVVIELSRNGRTRLGSWLLVVGLAAALGMDWFVLP